MALIQCYECSREISDKAPVCPHCGAPSISQAKVQDVKEQFATQPAKSEVRAKSGVMDGVKIGCGMFIVLPLLILLGIVVLIATMVG